VSRRAALVAIALSVATAAAAAEKEVPASERRFFALGELGWNGLAGIGVDAGWRALPFVTVEGGAGFSLLKWKGGVRIRAHLRPARYTPFIAAGALFASGDSAETRLDFAGNPLRYRTRPSQYAQLAAGLDYVGEDGVTLMATLGWAFLLAPNVDITLGTPNATQSRLLFLAYDSGPVASFAVGYSF